MSNRFRARPRIALPALAIAALGGLLASPWTSSGAQAAAPSIGFHFIGAGGHALQNFCYRLGGTAGQTAPGYSSSANFSLAAGFWEAAPQTSLDELFFDGFEDC